VDPRYVATKFHTFLANELQDIFEAVRRGEDQRAIFEVQPQIGKSRLVSELFPAWVLGMTGIDNRGWPIICASYGASLAEQKSSNCRDIVESDIYQIIFPETQLHPETAAKDYWKTTSGGAYRAVGVGGGLTGMSGKLLLCDDPFKDRQDADSETIREATWRWWQSVFMTRKQSKSGIAVVNTRWHMDDLTGRLEDQQKSFESAAAPEGTFDVWKRFNFPAFALQDEFLKGKLFRHKGEVLCPERFTLSDMVKQQNSMDPYEWSALYMQSPILQENAEFKMEWFRYYEPEEIKLLELTPYTVVDLAISQKRTADNTVVRTVGKDRYTGKIYLLEETAGRLDPLQTIDAIFHHVKTWRSRVWVESVAYQAALQYFIVEEMRKRSFYFDVNELTRKNVASKEERIRGLIALYKAGMIFHRRSDTELERELLQFPKGKHDDRADALSMIQDVMDQTIRLVGSDEKEQFDPHAAFNRI
jgi:predicted phage terminase large subunit-like protein